MCTLEKIGSIYILTLTGNDDHRLNPTLLDSMSAALHRIRFEIWSSSSSFALVTTAEGKFFSNGYDLEWAQSDKDRSLLMSFKFRSLLIDLISLPMPTIAAVSGHASAGGLILALSHDYILMRKDRGYIYLSELDIGLVIPPWFITILKTTVRSPAALRDALLRSEKLTAEVAVEKGIIDSAHSSVEETVRAALKLGEELVGRKWKGEVYAQNRKNLYAEVLHVLANEETVEDVNNARVSSRL